MGNERVICYVVRHGSTKANEQGRFRGRGEFPLDKKGEQDAEKVAEFLKDAPIGSAYTSSLKRAAKTAKIILKSKGKTAIPLDSLQPIDVGDFSGEKKSEHREDLKYLQDHPNKSFPNGQSINEFNEQSRKPLIKALSEGVRNENPSFIVTHASMFHSLGHLLHDDHNAALVKPGGIVVVTFDGHKFKATPIFKPKKAPDSHAS